MFLCLRFRVDYVRRDGKDMIGKGNWEGAVGGGGGGGGARVRLLVA